MRVSKFLLLAILLVLYCITGSGTLASEEDPPQAAARAARKVRQVIGHRGSCLDRPENTLASCNRAIEARATLTEVDVRTTRDGVLVCLHDADLDRTTSGKGPVGEKTLAELKELDAGSRFDPKFKGERIPTVREVLALCKGKIGVMLDLKETGEAYAEMVAEEVRKHGDPKQTVLGVRSVEHAKRLRKLLPETHQIGLVPNVDSIEAFSAAGVETIRLWPKWLEDKALVPRVRKLGRGLLLGAGAGKKDEVLPLLAHEPDSLSSDDPAQLVKTLAEIAGSGK